MIAVNENTAAKNVVETQVPVSVVSDFNYGHEKDVLTQFKANLAQVEELNQRLRYVLGEVSNLIQKRNVY
jgi:hypothetical protein